MPRTVKLAVPLALPADVYHALRSDRGFDLYCADKEGANFMLHSEGRTTDAGPHEITCTYSYKSLPKIMSAVLGSSARLEILSKMLYTPHLFGDANPTLVTTNPNVFGGRISTESRCYLEPTASGACILHVSATVDVRVFGVGTLVEGIFMGFLRDSYDKLEALALEYVRTPAFAAFASDEALWPAGLSKDGIEALQRGVSSSSREAPGGSMHQGVPRHRPRETGSRGSSVPSSPVLRPHEEPTGAGPSPVQLRGADRRGPSSGERPLVQFEQRSPEQRPSPLGTSPLGSSAAHAAGPLPLRYTTATLGSLGRLVSSGGGSGGSGGSGTRTIAIIGLEATSAPTANGRQWTREGSSLATEGSTLNGGANGRGAASHLAVPASCRAGVVAGAAASSPADNAHDGAGGPPLRGATTARSRSGRLASMMRSMVMAPRATSARALTISAFKKRDNAHDGAGGSHARAPTHDLLARAPSTSETTDVTDPDLDDGATLAADDEFVVLHELTNDAEESRGVKGSHALPSAVLGTDLADGARLTFDSAVLGTGLAAADGARLTFDATTTAIPKGSSSPGSSSHEGRLESSGIARSPEHVSGAVSGARSPKHVPGAVSGAPQDEPQTIDRVKGALSDMAASVGEGVEDVKSAVRSLSFRLSGRQSNRGGGGGGDGDSAHGECLDFLPMAESAEQRLLRQLKGLLDDGLITPEQFEAKRAELLVRWGTSSSPSRSSAHSPRLGTEEVVPEVRYTAAHPRFHKSSSRASSWAHSSAPPSNATGSATASPPAPSPPSVASHSYNDAHAIFVTAPMPPVAAKADSPTAAPAATEGAPSMQKAAMMPNLSRANITSSTRFALPVGVDSLAQLHPSTAALLSGPPQPPLPSLPPRNWEPNPLFSDEQPKKADTEAIMFHRAGSSIGGPSSSVPPMGIDFSDFWL